MSLEIHVDMSQLYRSMKSDGPLPKIESSARGLGVRIDEDVFPDESGIVSPGAGMSVAPEDPLLLPQFRRPEKYGGTGKDPVWVIDEPQLPDKLAYTGDSLEHGLIGPSVPMHLTAYEGALAATQSSWKLCP